MGLEPTNLLTASQALYQLSYAPGRPGTISAWPRPSHLRSLGTKGGVTGAVAGDP